MRLMGPGDETVITGAIAHARAAGVPEPMIQRAIDQDGAGRGGAVMAAAVAGRLNALARQYQSQEPEPSE